MSLIQRLFVTKSNHFDNFISYNNLFLGINSILTASRMTLYPSKIMLCIPVVMYPHDIYLFAINTCSWDCKFHSSPMNFDFLMGFVQQTCYTNLLYKLAEYQVLDLAVLRVPCSISGFVPKYHRSTLGWAQCTGWHFQLGVTLRLLQRK